MIVQAGQRVVGLARRGPVGRRHRVRVDGGPQSRAADLVRHVDVDAALDERAGDVEVAVDQREHQRRLLVGIDDVDVGACVERAP